MLMGPYRQAARESVDQVGGGFQDDGAQLVRVVDFLQVEMAGRSLPSC
jgi:hypothetical protein